MQKWSLAIELTGHKLDVILEKWKSEVDQIFMCSCWWEFIKSLGMEKMCRSSLLVTPFPSGKIVSIAHITGRNILLCEGGVTHCTKLH